MQPSDIYESTEVTVNGFKYKKTNATVANIFTLNSSVDNSIAYTEPLTSDFSNVSMWGWKNTSDAYYIQKSLVWGRSYKNSASATQDNAYNRVNKIEIDYSNFNFTGVPYIVFTESGGGNAENYTFGYSPEATGVNNNGTLNTHSLITDFEVNKTIWTIASLEGITTTEAALYLDDGTETAEHSIDVEQFLANPSNYLITKFSIGNRCTWDENNNDWRTNGTVTFCPCILFDSAETTGLYSLNQGPSGGATVAPSATGNLGFAGKFYAELWNNKQDNSTAVPAMNHPNKTFHRAFQNSYTLGANYGNLVIEPKELSDALTLACDLGTTGDFYVGYDELSNTSSYLQCYQHDKYTMVKDYSTATKSHLTSYRKYITTFLKGELVSKLIASCGVFFTQMTVAELNTAGCTPTHMDIDGLHLGEMDGSGYTTGNWINGEDIADYDGINKDGSIIHTGFKPGPPEPQPETDDNIESMTTGFVSNSGGLTKYWKMSSANLLGLLSDFNQHAPQGSSLNQNIVSLYVNAMSNTWSTGLDNIEIHSAGSQETPFTSEAQYSALLVWTHTKQLGYIDVPRVTNTFYDFSPYSTYELFIPFCGWIGLPDTVAGRRVRVELNIDISNMSCLGIVRCETSSGDSVCIGEITGTFGAPCPIQVIESGLYRQAMANSALQIASGASTFIASGATGNYDMAIVGGLMALQGAVQASGVGNTNYGATIGRNGDSSSLGRGHQCYLKITHPVIEPVVDTNAFAHSVGYMCNEVGTLNSFKGFTVCGNPHITGINATDAEKEEIKQLLESGVIL